MASLREYARRTGSGHAFGDNLGFRVELPDRRSFSPDAAFHAGPITADLLEGAPVFAVEIRSRDDYGPTAEERLAARRADSFAAGTLAVWDVDVERDGWVRVYLASEPLRPAVYRRGETADAGPAVPGWAMRVDDLFPPEPERG